MLKLHLFFLFKCIIILCILNRNILKLKTDLKEYCTKKNKKKRDKIRSNKNISLNKAESPKETITELDVEKEHFSKKIHMRKRTISIYFKYWHSAKLCLRLEKEHANYSQSV